MLDRYSPFSVYFRFLRATESARIITAALQAVRYLFWNHSTDKSFSDYQQLRSNHIVEFGIRLQLKISLNVVIRLYIFQLNPTAAWILTYSAKEIRILDHSLCREARERYRGKSGNRLHFRIKKTLGLLTFAWILMDSPTSCQEKKFAETHWRIFLASKACLSYSSHMQSQDFRMMSFIRMVKLYIV